jgi:hypothetical protein
MREARGHAIVGAHQRSMLGMKFPQLVDVDLHDAAKPLKGRPERRVGMAQGQMFLVCQGGLAHGALKTALIASNPVRCRPPSEILWSTPYWLPGQLNSGRVRRTHTVQRQQVIVAHGGDAAEPADYPSRCS